jgi:hypothetical protein
MQTPLTHEEKWADAVGYFDGMAKDYAWSASGRDPEVYREILADMGIVD